MLLLVVSRLVFTRRKRTCTAVCRPDLQAITKGIPVKELLVIAVVVVLSIVIAEPFTEYRNEILRLQQEIAASVECYPLE